MIWKTTYIDKHITEQHDDTNQEIENTGNEEYIERALTQASAWVTSDEGKRLRTKVWDRISAKWASFTGAKLYHTEFLNDASYGMAEELDDILKYIDTTDYQPE